MYLVRLDESDRAGAGLPFCTERRNGPCRESVGSPCTNEGEEGALGPLQPAAEMRPHVVPRPCRWLG